MCIRDRAKTIAPVRAGDRLVEIEEDKEVYSFEPHPVPPDTQGTIIARLNTDVTQITQYSSVVEMCIRDRLTNSVRRLRAARNTALMSPAAQALRNGRGALTVSDTAACSGTRECPSW